MSSPKKVPIPLRNDEALYEEPAQEPAPDEVPQGQPAVYKDGRTGGVWPDLKMDLVVSMTIEKVEDTLTQALIIAEAVRAAQQTVDMAIPMVNPPSSLPINGRFPFNKSKQWVQNSPENENKLVLKIAWTL